MWTAVGQGQTQGGPRGKGSRPQASTATPGANIQPKFVFSKFPDWVECVTFSPDGKTLAAGSHGVVKLIDVAGQQETAALTRRGGLVKAIAFSGDGKLLAAGGYQSLELWDVATGQIVRTLKGHRGHVTSLGFSPDQQTLASAADDETVKLWNVASGEMVANWKSLGQPALALAYSPDGQTLAVALGDPDRPAKKGLVRLFDSAGTPGLVLDGHTRIVSAVAFSPDGTQIATGSADESIKLWDRATGKERNSLEGHTRPVNSLAFVGGGKWLLSVSGGRAVGNNELMLWETSTGKELATIPAHDAKISQLALSPDGKFLATASVDKTAKVWDVAAILGAAGQKSGATVPQPSRGDAEFRPESPALPDPSTALGSLASLRSAEGQPAAAAEKPIRIGMIGLDTSHSVAFTQIINAPEEKDQAAVAGCRVVVAYPKGSRDIPSSVERVPEYTQKVKALGVEIVESIDELVMKCDAVLLETNDGRPHLEQVLPVLKAGKPVFIDKPIAGSLTDAVAIFEAARKYKTPVFSSSSLRYTVGAQAIRAGKIGEVKGCDAYSPCALEATHPDLFWYGIHGVESLFTCMGTGCESVTRINTPSIDVVAGVWKGGRVGTFRGVRSPDGGQAGYGGTAFGTKGVEQIGTYGGYAPLVFEIVKFFRTGKVPVAEEETLEIYAFMEAADESKRQGGKPVTLASVLAKAREAALQIKTP
ncbi:MAG: Gfo/Idh/MocA family oxidoreductase [Planctomycetes bacterium]|nr:Gfo/Idh/MocA family oxidoreductase [Planctomycetota bacterium]